MFDLLTHMFDVVFSEAGAVAGILFIWITVTHWQLWRSNKRNDDIHAVHAQEKADAVSALNGIATALELIKERLK